MNAPRRFRIPMLARAGITGVVAIIATLSVPTAGQADTTLGSLQTSPQPCAAGYDTVQVSSTGAAYAVPAGGGQITAWSIMPGAVGTGPVGLEVWRPSGTQFALVGSSPLVSLTGTAANSFTLATPITALQGDLLGLRIGGSVSCGQSTANAGDTYAWVKAATTTSPATMTQTSFFQLNVSATLSTATPTPPPTPKPTPTPTPTGGGTGGGTGGSTGGGGSTGDGTGDHDDGRDKPDNHDKAERNPHKHKSDGSTKTVSSEKPPKQSDGSGREKARIEFDYWTS